MSAQIARIYDCDLNLLPQNDTKSLGKLEASIYELRLRKKKRWPASESHWRDAIPWPHAPVLWCARALHWWRHLAGLCRSRASLLNRATSAVHSQSWALSILSSTTAKGTHCDALVPDGLLVLLLRGNIFLFCSWLHSLKIWSLLKTRGGSIAPVLLDQVSFIG